MNLRCKWVERDKHAPLEHVRVATPFEIEHIIPKAHGGSNRIGDLTLACHTCNIKKGKSLPTEIQDSVFRKKVGSAAKAAQNPLKDVASANSIRWKIADTLRESGISIIYGTECPIT